MLRAVVQRLLRSQAVTILITFLTSLKKNSFMFELTVRNRSRPPWTV